MPGRQRRLQFTLRRPKFQTGSPNRCLKLDSQANFWWTNNKIPCSFCNFRVVENAGFSKLKTQFSCFKTRLVWVSSVFPILSCHASFLSIVWWSKSAVRETYISRSVNQVPKNFLRQWPCENNTIYKVDTISDHLHNTSQYFIFS